MKFIKLLLWFLLLIIGLFILFLIYSTIDNYNPPQKVLLEKNADNESIADSVFSIVTWNIGYAGLDSTMDFFYDGGEKVRPKKEAVTRNIKGIVKTAESFKGSSFINIQEVDKNSKRSYGIDIYEILSNLFSDYHSNFAKNYDVSFVPLPPNKPMGKVLSGLQSLSKYTSAEVYRYSFPGNYKWPMSVFMLDRCFIMSRYHLINGKDLIIINTHNSAYDDGSLRKQQMDFLKEFLINEYSKNNFVVVGGDWNQCPNGFQPQFDGELFDREDLIYIEEGYPEKAWHWAYDPTNPTNRRVKQAYIKGITATTLIDYFLLSPNLEVLDVHGKDLDFAYSDHQPVFMTFKLR